MSDLYIENLLFYKQLTLDSCAKYQKKEIALISNIKNNNNNYLTQFPEHLNSNQYFEIKFDLKEPKVRF